MDENNLNNVENREEKIESENNNRSKNMETKVVLEKRKPSVFLSILLILIGAIISAIIILICFGNRIINSYKSDTQVEQNEENPEEKTEEVKEVRKLNLNVEGDFIGLLHNKLTNFSDMHYPLVYNSEITTYSSLSDNYKLLYTLKSLKYTVLNLGEVISKLDNRMHYTGDEMYKHEVRKIDFDDVSKKYKSIYGADKEVPLIDAETHAGYVYEYVAEDNCFYGHSYAGGGGTSFRYITKITDCEANEDCTEVYIYELFVGMNFKGADGYIVYKDGSQKNVIKEGIVDRESGMSLFENLTQDEFLNSNLSNGAKYKHTFKLDNAGNYYWYSTEPIE